MLGTIIMCYLLNAEVSNTLKANYLMVITSSSTTDTHTRVYTDKLYISVYNQKHI